MKRFLSRWLAAFPKSRPGRRPLSRARLNLEALEDRLCPSSVSETWSQFGGYPRPIGFNVDRGQKVHIDFQGNWVSPNPPPSDSGITWKITYFDNVNNTSVDLVNQWYPANSGSSVDFAGQFAHGSMSIQAIPSHWDAGYGSYSETGTVTVQTYDELADSALFVQNGPGLPLRSASDGWHVSIWDPLHGQEDTGAGGAESVALDPAHCPAGATLKGTTTANLSGGDAVFTNLVVNKPGEYRFIFTSPDGVQDIDDRTIVAPPIDRVSFACGQPQNGVVNKPLNTVEVRLLDADGALDTSLNGEVGLSLGANPGNATLSRKAGNLMAKVVKGLVTFKGLVLNKPGDGYTLFATCANGQMGSSDPFKITEPPPPPP
jgi:hypothetical protein